MFMLRDWVGVVGSAQLAVENFAKALIALFEIPTWSHDPSTQLLRLIDRLPPAIQDEARELAKIARELAPEHGRSVYGEPSRGLTPSDIYGEGHANGALSKAAIAEDTVRKVFKMLEVEV